MGFQEELRQMKKGIKLITEEEIYQNYLHEHYNQIKNEIKREVYQDKNNCHITGKIRVEEWTKTITMNNDKCFEEKYTDIYRIHEDGHYGDISRYKLEVKAPVALNTETHRFGGYNLITFELKDFGKRFVNDLTQLANNDGIQLSFQPGYRKNILRSNEQILEFPDFNASSKEKLQEYLYPCLFIHYEIEI